MTVNAVTPQSDYGYRSNALRTQRDAEYDAFSRVTRMLRQCDTSGSVSDRISAVHKNSELWTVLAADLADPGNGLPDDVKAGLISLAGMSVRHGHSVLMGEATPALLIDINLSVMKGLRGEAGA